MSVVAWDGRVLAADRQSTNNGFKYESPKLRYATPGSDPTWAIACVGDESAGAALEHWFSRHWLCGSMGKDTEFPKQYLADNRYATMLYVVAHVTKWSHAEQRRLVSMDTAAVGVFEGTPFPITIPPRMPYARGSGRDYALAAMAMGADAPLACAIACRFEESCGFGVDAYDLRTGQAEEYTIEYLLDDLLTGKNLHSGAPR